MGCSDLSAKMRASRVMEAGSCRWPRQYATSCRSSAELSARAAQSNKVLSRSVRRGGGGGVTSDAVLHTPFVT